MADKKGGDGEVKAIRDDEGDENQNMAAWLLGIKTLKIQPYHLPTLGIIFLSSSCYSICTTMKLIRSLAMPCHAKKKKKIVNF